MLKNPVTVPEYLLLSEELYNTLSAPMLTPLTSGHVEWE